MAQACRGRVVQSVTRRGKHVVLTLDDGSCVMIHLRMSGRLEWAAPDEARSAADESRHVRAWWDFRGGGRLQLADSRKFARIAWTDDFEGASARIGIEPLSDAFTPAILAGLMRSRARQLKPFLLDQSIVTGLGNIYVDEALHRSGLHPLARTDSIGPDGARRLHGAIRRVLNRAIAANGTSFDWIYPGGQMQNHLRVYGRTGEPCRRCGTPIQYLRVGQRGTHVCPACQRTPRRGRTRAVPRA